MSTEPSDTLDRALRTFGSSAEVARRLGVPASTVRSWRTRGLPEAWDGPVRDLTPAQALETLAPPVEVVPPRHGVKGVSTLVRADGSIAAQWIKTRRDHEFQEEIMERLLRDLPEIVPVRTLACPAPVTPARADLLAAYVVGDAHIGMRAWAKECGEAFDLEIAETLLVGAARDLVLRGPRTERAILLDVGDWFHSDTAHGHTTNGNHTLDLDGRALKVLGVGMRIFVAMIDAALEHHDSVTVDARIGNHDGHTALMLAIALQAHYRNEPRISVPPPVSHRAYHEFGRNLIGTTHGDRAKGADLAAIMAAEQPEAWGRTKHRTWWCGHIHHSTVTEYRGCTVESFRTLAARDAWHAGQGYVSGRNMQRIVLHREHGEVSRETVSPDAILGMR